MTSIARWAAWCVAGPMMMLACAPTAPTPSPTPSPVVVAPTPAAPVASNRVLLPRTQPRTNWTVSAVTRLKVSGAAMPQGVSDEQRIDTRALVSMSFDRSVTGALRGSGQVDSFTVRSSIAESARQLAATAAAPARPSLLLIDALIDSTNLRIVTRPPLANECDRPEVSAMQLARELLVRIPDGVVEGDQWRDSTVTLVCRNGVPLTVYTSTRSTLAKLSRETLVVNREINTTLGGKGGTAFRAFELVGTGTGSQRVEIAAATGILEKLQGTSTLTMQVVERIPPGTPRSQQVVQRLEIRAERVR
ncbi:hypothetical protein [Gemmatimonas groenlandica]|uniref:GerMN domain-containing protein n=1 Tax=Gemmatimonas groenlandica TaxID=2732249 RepID=A0A6M4IXG2_9BACT|nr:hypothetical protein [Gemmatimonas groenlandica]QJR36861.1 hypothetical protein HKW67_15725 [Gemmatimonas groenlandica]